MSYQIITDSCCDFTASKYQELKVTVLPLTVTYQGKSFPDRNDDSLKEMYDGFRAGEAASTAAANPEAWKNAFENALKDGMDVLALAFSSGLSTTYQSAVIAAEELKEVYPDRKILVADTLCASLGQGLLVWYTCKKRDAGMTIEALHQWVEENKLHLCHWFTVDDLMYLKRGGRISTATALLGTMLSVKPILHVDDEGHLVNVAKARGRKAAISALAQKFGELSPGYDNSIVFISHGDCLEEAESLAALLRDKYGVQEIYTNYIGAVIGSHAGPGTIALFFMGSHR